MAQPESRRLTDQQRAAHLLIGPIAERVAELRSDLVKIELSAKSSDRNADAKRDWAELKMKATSRLEGAGDILDVVRAMARGN